MKHHDWQEILETLFGLHEAAPGYRFGQLICNLSMHVGEPDTVSVWDVEDQDLLEAAKRLLEALTDQASPAAPS